MQVTVPVPECNIENTLVFTRLNCTTQQCWELSRQEGASLRFSAGKLLLSELPTKLGGLLLHWKEQHFKDMSEVNLCRKTGCTESLFLSLLYSQKPHLQMHENQPNNARQKNLNSFCLLFPSWLPFSPLQGITTFRQNNTLPQLKRLPNKFHQTYATTKVS